MILLGPLGPLRTWEEPWDLGHRGARSLQAAPVVLHLREQAFFCLFPPSRRLFLYQPFTSSGPWKARLPQCPPGALSLSPAQGEKESGAEGRPPHGRRQNQLETDLGVLELLRNCLHFSSPPSPNSSWHHPCQVVSTGGKQTLRPVVLQSGAEPKWSYTVLILSPWSIWWLH